MKPYLILIILLLICAFAITFFATDSVEAADTGVEVPWLIDCENDSSVDGFIDRGFCVPGVITNRTQFTRSPSRFYGVGSSYAPGVMEWMCSQNGGCDGYKDGVGRKPIEHRLSTSKEVC